MFLLNLSDWGAEFELHPSGYVAYIGCPSIDGVIAGRSPPSILDGCIIQQSSHLHTCIPSISLRSVFTGRSCPCDYSWRWVLPLREREREKREREREGERERGREREDGGGGARGGVRDGGGCRLIRCVSFRNRALISCFQSRTDTLYLPFNSGQISLRTVGRLGRSGRAPLIGTDICRCAYVTLCRADCDIYRMLCRACATRCRPFSSCPRSPPLDITRSSDSSVLSIPYVRTSLGKRAECVCMASGSAQHWRVRCSLLLVLIRPK